MSVFPESNCSQDLRSTEQTSCLRGCEPWTLSCSSFESYGAASVSFHKLQEYFTVRNLQGLYLGTKSEILSQIPSFWSLYNFMFLLCEDRCCTFKRALTSVRPLLVQLCICAPMSHLTKLNKPFHMSDQSDQGLALDTGRGEKNPIKTKWDMTNWWEQGLSHYAADLQVSCHTQ